MIRLNSDQSLPKKCQRELPRTAHIKKLISLHIVRFFLLSENSSGGQSPHQRSLAGNVWYVESSRPTQPKPQPQEPCPLSRATRPAVDPIQPPKRAPGSLGRGPRCTVLTSTALLRTLTDHGGHFGRNLTSPALPAYLGSSKRAKYRDEQENGRQIR